MLARADRLELRYSRMRILVCGEVVPRFRVQVEQGRESEGIVVWQHLIYSGKRVGAMIDGCFREAGALVKSPAAQPLHSAAERDGLELRHERADDTNRI